MKRLKYAVILLLGLSMATMMSSCKKDNSQLIAGEWVATNTVYGSHSFSVYEGDSFVFTTEELSIYPDADGLTTFPDEYPIPYKIEGSSLTLIGWGAKGGNTTFIIDELKNTTLKISGGYIDGQLVLIKK